MKQSWSSHATSEKDPNLSLRYKSTLPEIFTSKACRRLPARLKIPHVKLSGRALSLEMVISSPLTTLPLKRGIPDGSEQVTRTCLSPEGRVPSSTQLSKYSSCVLRASIQTQKSTWKRTAFIPVPVEHCLSGRVNRLHSIFLSSLMQRILVFLSIERNEEQKK